MSELTKQALKVENNQSFPNNNAGLITPSALRTFNEDMIDSTVNQAVYTADSASWNQQIAALDPSGSAESITALNAFTQSADQRLDSLEAATGSYAISSSVAAVDAAQQSQINSLIAATGSYVTSAITGSSLITASFSGNTLTFTKGNNSTFGIVIPDNSGSSIASLNAFTASQQLINSSVNAFTASSDQRLDSIELFTSSQQLFNDGVTAFQQTQQTENTLNQTKWSNLGSQSGSFVTESETGSFARTNVTNTFTQNQIIQGTLTAYTMSADTLNVRVLNTTIESSSVIFSSGSNVLGDAANDVQTLNGSVRIVNELTASGLRYPTTDGVFSGQVLQTNAAGTLSFGNVNAIFETIRNGESTSITVGTPLYVSGSQGASPIVYRADATNPAKMPATFVAFETIAAGQSGRGLTLGLITGIDMTGYTVGDALYVDGLGLLTNVRPTGSNDIVQPIGIVTKPGNGGQLNVLNPGPVLLPNIQTGYTWVGNGTNQPTAVATSSFASLTDLSSLNAFTQSAQSRLNNIELTTASLQSQVNGLSNATSSYALSASVATVDAAQQLQINSLINATGSYVTSSVNISSLNAFTASQQALNTTFATTGSNIFVGNQTITGSLTLSSSAAVDLRVIGGTTMTGSLLISSSVGLPFANTNGILTQYFGNTFGGNIGINDNSTLDEIGFALDGGTWTTNWGNGPILYVNNTPGDTYEGVFGFQNKANYTDGRITALKRLDVSGSVNIQNTLTASLQQGYVWVGDASGRTTTVPTSSFGGGGSTDISSLNAFTASAQIRLTNLELETASLESSVTNLNSFTSSQQGLNGTFATTGSNNFIGNQTITGSVTISGSATNDLTVIGTIKASGSTSSTTINPSNFIVVNNSGGGIGGALDFGNYIAVSTADGSELTLAADANQYSGNWAKGPAIVSNSPSDTYPAIIGFQNKSNWTDGRPTFLTQVDFSNNINVTGSVRITGTLTSSLQQGYVWVGDANGRTTTVSTGSFGGGGGSAFPFTGSAQITGSLGLTGSISEFVNTLTIASSTASVNFNDGNMFTLTLVTGSVTHITPTNIRRGQTINIQINQPAGVSSGSVSFSPNVLFAGGNDYQATATGSAIDLLTFVSLDGTNVLGTSIKNFL